VTPQGELEYDDGMNVAGGKLWTLKLRQNEELFSTARKKLYHPGGFGRLLAPTIKASEIGLTLAGRNWQSPGLVGRTAISRSRGDRMVEYQKHESQSKGYLGKRLRNDTFSGKMKKAGGDAPSLATKGQVNEGNATARLRKQGISIED